MLGLIGQNWKWTNKNSNFQTQKLEFCQQRLEFNQDNSDMIIRQWIQSIGFRFHRQTLDLMKNHLDTISTAIDWIDKIRTLKEPNMWPTYLQYSDLEDLPRFECPSFCLETLCEHMGVGKNLLKPVWTKQKRRDGRFFECINLGPFKRRVACGKSPAALSNSVANSHVRGAAESSLDAEKKNLIRSVGRDSRHKESPNW